MLTTLYNRLFAAAKEPSAPATDYYQVTASDSADNLFRSLRLTVDGTLRVTTAAGNVRNYPSGHFTVGDVVPLCVTKVHATGTTATVWGFV